MAKKPIKKKPQQKVAPAEKKSKVDPKSTIDNTSGALIDCLAGDKKLTKLTPPTLFKIDVEDDSGEIQDPLTRLLQPFGNRDLSSTKITNTSSITDVDAKFSSIAFKLSSRIDMIDGGLANLNKKLDSAIGQLNKKYEAEHKSSVQNYRKLEAQLSDIKQPTYGRGGLVSKGGKKITGGGSRLPFSGTDLAAMAILVYPHLKKNYLDPFFAKYDKEIGDITNSIADNRAAVEAARKAARITSGAVTASRTVAKGVGAAVQAVTPKTPAPKTPTPTPKTYGTPGTTTSFSGAPRTTPVPIKQPLKTKSLTAAITKRLGRAVFGALLRNLPVVGLGLAMIDAGVRIGRGDKQGAALAAGSGVTGLIPLLGTVTSLGFNAVLVSHDIFKEVHGRDPIFTNQEDLDEIGRILQAMGTFTKAKEAYIKAEINKANNQALRQSDEKTFMAAMAKTGQMRRGQYTGMEMDEQVASTTKGGYLFGMIGGKRVPGKTVTLDQNRQVPAYDINMGRMNLGAKGVPGTVAGSSNYMAQFAGSAGITTPSLPMQRQMGSAGITTPPLPMQRQMAMMPPLPTMKPQPLSFASNSFRERVYQQKSQFMQFGALPGGFENVMGNRGILGKPVMVAASGAQPFGGGFGGGGFSGGNGSSGGGGPAYSGVPGGSGLASPGTAPAGGTGGTEFSSDQMSGAGKQSHAGLAKQRTELFGKEMLNDDVVRQIAMLQKTEVGGMGHNAEADWLESYVNGAVVRRTSLQGRLRGKHRKYWAHARGKRVTDAEMERTRQQLISVIKQGRNVTKGATDNASAGVARRRIAKLTREGRRHHLYHTENKSGRTGELLYVDSYLVKRQKAMMKQADDYQKQIEKQQQEKANAQQKVVAKSEAVAAPKDMGPGYDDFGPSAGAVAKPKPTVAPKDMGPGYDDFGPSAGAVAKGEAVAAPKDMGPGYDDFGPSAGTADFGVMKVKSGTVPDTIADRSNLTGFINGRPVEQRTIADDAEELRKLREARNKKYRFTGDISKNTSNQKWNREDWLMYNARVGQGGFRIGNATQGVRSGSGVEQKSVDIAGFAGSAFSMDGDPIKGLKITEKNKLSNYGSRGRKAKYEYIAVHYTAGNSLRSALNRAKSANIGYQYLIDKDGTVHMVQNPDTGRSNHWGVKQVNRKIGNHNSVGVSFVGMEGKATKAQIIAGMKLIEQQRIKYGIKSENVLGHGEATAGHRSIKEGDSILTPYRQWKGVRNPNIPNQAARRFFAGHRRPKIGEAGENLPDDIAKAMRTKDPRLEELATLQQYAKDPTSIPTKFVPEGQEAQFQLNTMRDAQTKLDARSAVPMSQAEISEPKVTVPTRQDDTKQVDAVGGGAELDIGATPTVKAPEPPSPTNDAKSAILAMGDSEAKAEINTRAADVKRDDEAKKAKDGDSKNSSRTRSAGGRGGSGQHHPEQEAPRAGSSGYGASGRCWV